MRMLAAAIGIASLLFIGCAGGEEPATEQMEEPAAEMMEEGAEMMEEGADTMEEMADSMHQGMEEAMPEETEGEGGESGGQ